MLNEFDDTDQIGYNTIPDLDDLAIDFKVSVLYYNSVSGQATWTKDDLNISKKVFPYIIENPGGKSFDSDEFNIKQQLGSKICWYEGDDQKEHWMIINKSFGQPETGRYENWIYTFLPLDNAFFKGKMFKKVLKEKNKLKLKKVLTKREIQVLKGICMGESTKSLAERLFLSRHTVRSHRQNIGRKLNTSKSTRLAAIASAMGILS